MADHPQLFFTPMVLALLREVRAPGTGKTQTRRTFRPGTCTVLGSRWSKKAPWSGLLFDHPATTVRSKSTLMQAMCGDGAPEDLHLRVPFLHPADAARGMQWEDDQCFYRVRPIVQAGDRLWVRESCRTHEPVKGRGECVVRYRADPDYLLLPEGCGHWDCRPRTAIHMPRWASRLTLVVTDVRIQRLHDISEEDALAEGIVLEARPLREGQEPFARYLVPGLDHPIHEFPELSRPTAREMYAALWDVIHGPGHWSANPWVIAFSFRPHLSNIDHMRTA